MIIELPPLPDRVAAAHKPIWGTGKVRHRACPVCENDIPIPFVKRPDKFNVHSCSECGMIYLADIPSEQCLRNYYDNYCDCKNYEYFSRLSKTTLLKIKGGLYVNPYLDILINTGGIKDMAVCDIGCSFGSFLEMVKICGGSPFAVEIDSIARKALKSKGIPNAMELGNGLSFDIICLFQVLEHLASPSNMLEKISNALKPDGRLLISVPNTGEFAKIGPSWVGFRVDMEHLNYFALKSLSNLLVRHNLYIEQVWEHGQPNLQRNVKMIHNSRLLQKYYRKILNLTKSRFSATGFAEQGTFNITILARKI